MVLLRTSPGQAKVPNLGLEVLVQEDVAGLDVAVDDVVGVQVAQAAGGAQGDVGALLPRQRRRAASSKSTIRITNDVAFNLCKTYLLSRSATEPLGMSW